MVTLITESHQLYPIETTFMVFAPGKKDILNTIQLLKTRFKNMNISNFTALPAYGELTAEENDKIYLPTPGSRKIAVTTNLFESAVTIQNVSVVFDTTLEKRRSKDEVESFITTYVSKASANQRAGRTGRTMEGTCYRMCTKSQYDALEDFRPMDIIGTPIYGILLKLIITEVPDILQILPAEVKSKSPEAIKLMRNLGIISPTGEVTSLGHFYYKLRISMRSSCFIWWWLKTNSTNYYAGVILALLINNYNDTYFYYNNEEINPGGTYMKSAELSINRDKYKQKYFFKFKGESDLHTFMN
ncbi:MAG TPA: helicase-related protein, partial [Aquella sp.]|nr:helicase-related protein [Aquella sp.]